MKNSYEEFSKVVNSKTPSELKVMLRNLKYGNAPYKEAKMCMIEKRLLRMVR